MQQTACKTTKRDWRIKLGETLVDEQNYAPEIEGIIPPQVNGVLYRNGPGRFDRGGPRKNSVLDGDGMIQAFRFHDGKATYQNRYVQTEKFQKEEAANRLIHETWSTRAPGGFWRNLGVPAIKSQAGVTIVYRNDKLYTFDEVGVPYILDPDTLQTIGTEIIGDGLVKNYKAHTKVDPISGDWIMFSTEFGRVTKAKFVIQDKEGTLRSQFSIDLPRSAYLHDFFATENYLILNLHPATLSLLPMLTGMTSFIDSLKWDDNAGNLILIVQKNGDSSPILIEAPTSWMWHSYNAYEDQGKIIADFIGYDRPDHFLGDKAAFRTIMNGELGVSNSKGYARRYEIDLEARKLREEIVSTSSFEFPAINPEQQQQKYQYGYMSMGTENNIFHSALARIDFNSGHVDSFDFGSDQHVGEPVFVPNPEQMRAPTAGWLMAIGLDGKRGTSYLTILDAQHLSDGPVAKLSLSHHTPLSFHGWWRSI